MTPPKWIRREFPVLRGRVVLDNASASPLPRSVARTMAVHLRRWSDVPQSQLDLDAVADGARIRAAALMNVLPENVSFVPSVTTGVSFVARGLRLNNRESVVVPEDEYPATLLPWRERERNGGARVVRPRASQDAVEAALHGGSVRVLCLSAVGWLGYRYDVERLARTCRSRDVILILDTSQSCGLYDFDINTDSRFVCVTSFSKWAFGPEGVACVSVSPDVAARLYSVVTGVDACIFDANHSTHCEIPEAVRIPLNLYGVAPILACGLNAALEWGASINRAEARIWVERLVAEAESRIAHAGFIVHEQPVNHRSGILLFTSPNRSANQRIVASLRRRGIYIQQRADWIRISFHIYNRLRDVRLLVGALTET